MSTKSIISYINEIRNSHAEWVEFGQILVEGVNLETAEEPLKCTDCDFSTWLVSSKHELSSFDWYTDLKIIHRDFHQAYSFLYHETMRMYKPKTVDELIASFTSLEDEFHTFNTKLDEMTADLETLNDKEIQGLVNNMSSHTENVSGIFEDKSFIDSLVADQVATKSNNKDENEAKESEIKVEEIPEDQEDQLKMKTININQRNEVKSVINSSEYEKSTNINDVIEKMRLLKQESNISSSNTTANWSDNINQNIKLKERAITQLKNEKELLQLELTNLSERQVINKQSVEQVAQYYVLKEQEIAQDNNENNQLLDLKRECRNKTKDEIIDLKVKKSGLAKFIQDLEKEHEEESLAKKDAEETDPIKEQLEELKQNKTKSLEQLLQHLNLRKVDLKKLRDQLVVLEDEISSMETELERKQKDLLDITEKEEIKNKEQMKQQTEQEQATAKRAQTINDKQDELYSLIEESNKKNSELDQIELQIEELTNNNILIAQANEDTLKDIIKQQTEKDAKTAEIDELKTSKQAEKDILDAKINEAEKTLKELRSNLSESAKEKTETV